MLKKLNIAPATRLSLGLVFMTGTVLMTADLLGLIPNTTDAAISARIHTSESVAYYVADVMSRQDTERAQQFAENIVERNEDLLSMALRLENGTTAFQTTDHDEHWQNQSLDKSTPNQIVLPLNNSEGAWGRLELAYMPLGGSWGLSSVAGLLLFTSVGTFGVYRLYLRRVLNQLDPSSVIPKRVKAVLDTMSEGVLVMDGNRQIVLANDPLLDALGMPLDRVLGKKAKTLPWKPFNPTTEQTTWPWEREDESDGQVHGEVLTVTHADGRSRIYVVNTATIHGADGRARGMLATFDDITGIEEKNVELQQMLQALEASQKEVANQNEQLAHQTEKLKEEVSERKRAQQESEQLNQQLQRASHQAGMAEVATNVLHNVGNVLAAANSSLHLIGDKLAQSRIPQLSKAISMVADHKNELGRFLEQDEKGKLIPDYLIDLTEYLSHEQQSILDELKSLDQSMDHIKDVVHMQQTLAKIGEFSQDIDPDTMIKESLQLVRSKIEQYTIDVSIDNRFDQTLCTERHRLQQILVNLISNAADAVMNNEPDERRIRIRIDPTPEQMCRIVVEDNGIGIPKDTMPQLFKHGFTTKEDGHGFGLHSAANAAKEMGGSLTAQSEGTGQGARFTLELPSTSVREEKSDVLHI